LKEKYQNQSDENTLSNKNLCGIKRLRIKFVADNLPEEAEALDLMLGDAGRWSSKALGAALKDEGYDAFVTDRTILRHRSGKCSCH